MSTRVVVSIGSHIVWDGSACTITDIAGDSVIVKFADNHYRTLRMVELLRPAQEGGRARLPGASDDETVDSEVSLLWAYASRDQREQAEERAGHLREILTGFSTGDASTAPPGQPRPEYAPGTSRSSRYRAKSAELGVTDRTLRRWVRAFNEAGVLGLIDSRLASPISPFGSIDSRWLQMAARVLGERTDEARVTSKALFAIIKKRLEDEHGPNVVKIPSQSRRYEALKALERGRGILSAPTKSKRSIASRPAVPYKNLVATRPGEYALMDSTRLDVHAFDPMSARWVNTELTVLQDLYSRAILGLLLSPISTKSIDVASVIYEAIEPFEFPAEWDTGAVWPYHGMPDEVLVNTERIAVAPLMRGGVLRHAEGLVPGTLVTDHGKPYVSEHLIGVCARLGISMQPTHKYSGANKPQVESFFKTVRTGLLERLPGFKGEDVNARGRHPERDVFYTVPQLEMIIREWTATIYHRRPHSELNVAGLHGVELSPEQQYEHGVAVAGEIALPSNRNLRLEVLPTEMRMFHHYGVEFRKLIYSGPIVAKYHSRIRHTGPGGKSWAFSFNPDDISQIYFCDPEDGQWHTLRWTRMGEHRVPFSLDALERAKQIAAADPDKPDFEDVLAQFLDRIRAGDTMTPEERRIAIRDALRLADGRPLTEPSFVGGLAASDAAIAADRALADSGEELTGDDDVDDEVSADPSGDFYGTALEDL